MNLLILSRRASLYSTRRLGLCAMARRHEVRLVNPLRCSVVLGRGAARILVAGEPVGPVDAVLARFAPTSASHSLAVLRQFEAQGALCVNRAAPAARARDKMRTLQALAKHGVPIVPTALARHPADVRVAIERLGGAPCVVKFAEGTQGAGVMFVESTAGAASVVEALVAAHRNLLLQPYIPHREDRRLFVVGGRVVAAIRRLAAEGNFRSNVHQGAVAVAHHPDDHEAGIATAAAAALGLEVAGVDLLPTPEGPVVVEVNASPGLEGIEGASGRNVAGAIIAHLERRLSS